MPEKFWVEDPLVLIHPKYLHRFFPTERFHIASRMNAIVRASVYIGVTMGMIQRQISWILLPIISLAVTASWMYRENPEIFKRKSSKNKKGEGFTNKKEDSDLEYLVSVILDNYPMENQSKPKKHKRKHSVKPTKKMRKNLFRDTDEIMQELQTERAIQTDSVAGRIPDTPNFARKLLGMDSR